MQSDMIRPDRPQCVHMNMDVALCAPVSRRPVVPGLLHCLPPCQPAPHTMDWRVATAWPPRSTPPSRAEPAVVHVDLREDGQLGVVGLRPVGAWEGGAVLS